MPRYGDLDALIVKLTTAQDCGRIPDVNCDNFPITIPLRDLKRFIREFPTADVAEVRHGYWETERTWNTDLYPFYSHTCKADGCGYEYRDTMAFGYKYCPNCGARMDAERSEQ